MDKKIKSIIIIIVIVVVAAVIGLYFHDLESKSNENNTTIVNNTTNVTKNITDIEESTKSSSSTSNKDNSHNGLKYKDGVWYDPNDPSTWYDSNGEWQKMEPDITKEFAYNNAGPNDKYYNSYGHEVSKEEYFNDPNIKWA